MADTKIRAERKPAEPGKPVIDPADWTGAELNARTDWMYHLTGVELADLDRAIRDVAARGLDIMEITRDTFALPVLGPRLAEVRRQLLDGTALTLLRGFNPHDYSRAEAAAAFFGIGAHLGRAVSQNAKGHMLGHVKALTDLDYNDPANAHVRGYQTRVDQRFHADSCDIVGLMCLQTPQSGGMSSVVSTVAVYNEMLRRRPDLVAELSGPVYWDRRGEVPPGKDPWYILPVFNFVDGWFSCRYGRQYIDSTQRFEQVPRTTPAQKEALDMMDALLAELRHTMQFQIGDIQFLYNHVTLHSRSAFVDWPEPERKRHLMRLWLCIDDLRPLPDVLAERTRGGIVTAGTKLHAPLEAE
jgi:alpha-ketoglutarate-dependent taurine dioxygenase